jgi:uncharacterized protein (DUF362 family)
MQDQRSRDGSRKSRVSIVRYEKPYESVNEAVSLCGGLANVNPDHKVFIKPNIVFWTRHVNFPKWGVITTSRVVEDMVLVLKEMGINDITIGEGIVLLDPKDRKTPIHAFEHLGFEKLHQRYGVRCLNFYERPYRKVILEKGLTLNINGDILDSDYVISLPVLKTHAQTVVSLGMKNLKGALDVESRKICHQAEPDRDLNNILSKLAQVVPHHFTIIDGIFTNERGPAFDGKIRRKNLLIASSDVIAADAIGAKILGYDPENVPHISHVLKNNGRSKDLTEIEVVGEALEAVSSKHKFEFPYAEDDNSSLPLPMKRLGIKGLSYRKYDLSMCTYCSYYNAAILTSVAQAWAGEPWDDIEVLTGKSMNPSPGKKKTILLGKCMVQKNRDNPRINEMYAVKGCPPKPAQIIKAFNQAGIPMGSVVFDHFEKAPELFLMKYEGKPEFDEGLFRIE